MTALKTKKVGKNLQPKVKHITGNTTNLGGKGGKSKKPNEVKTYKQQP